MSRAGHPFDVGRAVVAGVVAGLCLMGFEMSVTSLSGAGAAGMPLRMAAAIVLGRRALAPDYSFATAATMGVAVYIVLSVVCAAAFMAIVSWIPVITEGELLTTTVERVFAGVVFGVVLWLVSFYVVAPLAGWTWFPENTHHTIAFLGGVFFGGVLGTAVGGLRVVVPRGA